MKNIEFMQGVSVGLIVGFLVFLLISNIKISKRKRKNEPANFSEYGNPNMPQMLNPPPTPPRRPPPKPDKYY